MGPFKPCFSEDICLGVGLLNHIAALFLFLFYLYIYLFFWNLHTVLQSGEREKERNPTFMTTWMTSLY